MQRRQNRRSRACLRQFPLKQHRAQHVTGGLSYETLGRIPESPVTPQAGGTIGVFRSQGTWSSRQVPCSCLLPLQQLWFSLIVRKPLLRVIGSKTQPYDPRLERRNAATSVTGMSHAVYRASHHIVSQSLLRGSKPTSRVQADLDQHQHDGNFDENPDHCSEGRP